MRTQTDPDCAPPRSARTVIHESSLLSFPLLSTLASTSRASTSSFTSTSATYSSMPLTAGAISGRRSYGGANVEIEVRSPLSRGPGDARRLRLAWSCKYG